jgi:hypothetical protein
MVLFNLSKTALSAMFFIFVGILTLVITYLVHKENLASGFKGGFWTGFSFILIGLILVIFINSKCSSESHANSDIGHMEGSDINY